MARPAGSAKMCTRYRNRSDGPIIRVACNRSRSQPRRLTATKRSLRDGGSPDLERVHEDQPGDDPRAGLPGDRRGGHHQLQPAARRVSDTHPAEALVPALRARSADLGDRQGLRVREGTLRRHDRGRHVEGASRVHARDRSRAVHRRRGDRSDLRREAVLSGAGRADGARGVRGDARRHEGEGRHRQARALRARVSRRGAAARQGPRDVHHAARQGSAQHGATSTSSRRCRRRSSRKRSSSPSR